MNKRRSFIKKGVAGIALASLLPLHKKAEASSIELHNGLVHMVYFWLKNPDSMEDLKAMEEGLQKLKTIKTIQMSHIGQPAPTENRGVVDLSFTFSIMVMFTDKEAHDAYQVDPIHLDFIEKYGHLWKEVKVYDSIG